MGVRAYMHSGPLQEVSRGVSKSNVCSVSGFATDRSWCGRGLSEESDTLVRAICLKYQCIEQAQTVRYAKMINNQRIERDRNVTFA